MKSTTSPPVTSFREALFFEHDNIASIMMSNALKDFIEESVIIIDKTGIILSFNQQARITYTSSISIGGSINKIWGDASAEIEEALFSCLSMATGAMNAFSSHHRIRKLF